MLGNSHVFDLPTHTFGSTACVFVEYPTSATTSLRAKKSVRLHLLGFIFDSLGGTLVRWLCAPKSMYAFGNLKGAIKALPPGISVGAELLHSEAWRVCWAINVVHAQPHMRRFQGHAHVWSQVKRLALFQRVKPQY
jgi:hypothetical protein